MQLSKLFGPKDFATAWRVSLSLLLLLSSLAAALGQLPVSQADGSAGVPVEPEAYILGSEDQIVVRVFHADEFSDKPIQIGSDGVITLPFLGAVKAAGLTVRQLERNIASDLSRYLRHPQVTISIAEYRSQPVSVLGAFNNPGVQQVKGSKTLVQMIALAGGLRADAGNQATIVRQKQWGTIPIPAAHPDDSGNVSVAVVNLKDLLSAKDSAKDITIRPNDTISVPRSPLIYVLGEVNKAGGFPLQEAESLSAMQALSLAGGMTRTAAPKHARILRSEPGRADRKEIFFDLQKVAGGTAPDVALTADDILFIPNNVPKAAALRAAEAAIQIGTGLAIFGR
jgi:polysaccharide export outer membrane protein